MGLRFRAMEAPALVGRQGELAYLAERLERATRGQTRIVVVTGEPGAGKTRLLAELAARVRRRATVLLGRGSPLAASIPFATISEAMGAHLRALPSERRDPLVRGIADELGPLLLDVRASATAASTDRSRLTVLEAFATLLSRLAETRPVVLALDDLHQADASTWELVGYLGREPPDARILVVAATRPHGSREATDMQRYVATLTKDGLAEELRLGPLDAEAIGDLAERMLGPGSSDPELRAWLFDRTRGNALYAVAVLEELRRDPSRRVVPVTVKERVRVEMLDLATHVREALEVAAVLGHRFTLRQVAAVLPEGSGATIDELVERGLLVERGGDGTATFDFAHPLVQEAVYGNLGAGRRRELHARVASALAGEPLAVRAYHIARGALAGDRDAVDVLIAAAEEAGRTQAHREALGYLVAAFELVPRGWEERRRVLDLIAWHAAEASDHTIAIPALRELAELVPDDPVALATTRMRLASVLATGAGDLAGAETEARAAIGLFERAAPDRKAAAINELGWIQALGGDFAAQDRACREAIALAEEAGDDTTLLHALGPLGHSLSLRGAFAEAHGVIGRSVALAVELGDVAQIGWHRGVEAMAFALEGRFAGGTVAIDSLLASGPCPSDVAYFNRAWLDWHHGRWSMALADCEAIESLHPTAPSAHSAWTLSLAAALHAAAGVPARGRALLAQAERVYGDVEFYWFSAAHRWASGQAARIAGDLAAAADRFERAVAWIRGCGLDAMECQMIPDAVEVVTDAGRRASAEALAERAGRLAGGLRTTFARAAERHAVGVVDRDSDALRSAAEGYAEVEARALEARALERLGRTTSGGDGLAALAEAARRYAELPAPVLADRVRGLMRERGPSGRRAAQRVGGLTPREREIAALVGRGMMSREVADRLHLSVRTVDSHLARIYGKLGISGRRELREQHWSDSD